MSKKEGEKYSVACDFDGVLHQYTSPWEGPHVVADPPVPGAIEWLERISKKFTVYIFSTRSAHPSGVAAMIRWFKGNGLSEETLAQLQFSVSKPAALLYIDDRGFRFEGTFPEAEEIHRLRPWNKK